MADARPGRRLLTVLALVSFSLAISLLLAEGALRGLRPPAASIIRYPCLYVPDDVLGFRYRPKASGRVAGHFEIDNVVRMNAQGFYDDEPLPPGASRLRVVAVGDSFTAALNLPREAVWTSVLERELRERVDASADVVNLGLDGTGTDVHVEILREYLPALSPDVVLVAFFANDLQDVLNGRFQRECYRDYVLSFQTAGQRDALRAGVDAHLERRWARWLFDHSYLVRLFLYWREGSWNLFRLEFSQPRLAELGIDDRVRRQRRPRLDSAFDELEAIAATCRCRLFVVPVPPRRRLAGSADALRPYLRGRALSALDVVPVLQQMLRSEGRDPADLYFRNDNHLNAYGNQLFARALAQAIPWAPRGE